MSQFEMGPGKKLDPSKPIESGTARYSHGGSTQEEREKSAREAGSRLDEDLKARRAELVRNLSVNMPSKDLLELKNIMMQTQGSLSEQERTVIWSRIQAIEAEKRKS